MSNKPKFKSTEVKSMQWNRTVNMDLLKSAETDALVKQGELSKELMDKVAMELKNELKKSEKLEEVTIKIRLKEN